MLALHSSGPIAGDIRGGSLFQNVRNGPIAVFNEWPYCDHHGVTANGSRSMHLVAMKVLGSVFRVSGTPWDYHNYLRPLALGVGGFATCEVVLSNPDGLITLVPQQAELHFCRIVELEDGVEEIDLYDGPKLILKFRPMTLIDVKAADATA
jgi:hypothetical protein